VDVDRLLVDLLRGIRRADPALLSELVSGDSAEPSALAGELPRLEARSTPPRRIAILAGSRRQRRRLEEAASKAGWLVASGSAEEDSNVALAHIVFSTSCDTVLIGADRSPGGDERRHLPDLAALAAAARRLRPELTIVLAGGAAALESVFAGPAAGTRPPAPAPRAPATMPQPAAPAQAGGVALFGDAGANAGAPEAGPLQDSAATDGPEAGTHDPGQPSAAAEATQAESTPMPVLLHVRGGSASVSEPDLSAQVLIAPDAEAGRPAGSALRQVLEGLRALPNDSRMGISRSIGTLAEIYGRAVEVVEVGLGGGLRARSQPVGVAQSAAMPPLACPADGSFAPYEITDDVVDGVAGWSTVALDRVRLTDRLHDLRLAPWAEAHGDGALLRIAAARAALGRLGLATPELGQYPLPELLVAAGGIFASAPPAVVALVLADLIRRPGVSQLVFDHARLLGPLGALADESERRRLLANLADDILLPLGCLVLPIGVKPGRAAGGLRLQDAPEGSEIELHPGTLQVIDLPVGQSARVVADFRDNVRLGTRGRHFAMDVTGGLGGLLVDLREVPLRLPDRPESRRAALEALQRGMWPELDD
jgi:hypothetical protein